MKCEYCQADPTFRDSWGCETPADLSVWETGDEVFYNCPLRFIPGNVAEWAEEYSIFKEFKVFPGLDKIPSKWIDALFQYKGFLADAQKEMADNKRDRQQGDLKSRYQALKSRG